MVGRSSAYLVAVLGLVVITGCVGGPANITMNWRDPRFNDRIRADFAPLTPADSATDLRYGFFRDGADGGLVDELFPVAAASPNGGVGGLVQTPCLFVGEEVDAGRTVAADELRLVWELIARWELAGEPSDEMKAHFAASDMTLGLCTLSTPGNRLLFENGEAGMTAVPAGRNFVCRPDSNESEFNIPYSQSTRAFNVPNRCVFGHMAHELVLESVAPGPDQATADGTCPMGHFAGAATLLGDGQGASGWATGARWSACGYAPNHVQPLGDASYRVTLPRGAQSFPRAETDTTVVERWLSPSVMEVRGTRTIVRPMEASTPGGSVWSWRAGVEQPGGSDGPVRWLENYTPTVRVRTVEIVSRAEGKTEQVVIPRNRQITISVPRPDDAPIDIVCTLKTGQTAFQIPADCANDDPTLKELTPTYAPAFLNATRPVKAPIIWSATTDPLDGRSAFVRFGLHASGQPPLLRMSPLRDFGRLQQDAWRQDTLELQNVGGQPLRVDRVGFAPGSAHPGEFSFMVVGEPRMVPLPIAAVPGATGGTAFELTPDASEAPLLTFDESTDGWTVALGDPRRGSAPQPLRVYGQPARLWGALLVRDDPAAVLAPTAPATDRPFNVTAYAERAVPFLLAPGETVRIAVIAQPTGLGVRTAALRVEATSLGSQSPPLRVQGALRVESLQGPQIHWAPERLWLRWTAEGASHGARRAAVIDNVGLYDLDVTAVRVQGPHASRFTVTSSKGSAPFRLPTADYSDLWVTYAPECDGTYGTPTSAADHTATLVVESTGGRAEIPLSGSSIGFCVQP